MLTPETDAALRILYDAEALLSEHSGGRCPCGDERGLRPFHYAYRHVLDAARYLNPTLDVTAEPDEVRFLVYGTPQEGGLITEEFIGNAATKDDAIEKAAAWVRARPTGCGAFVLDLSGFVYHGDPFEPLRAEAEARRLMGCE